MNNQLFVNGFYIFIIVMLVAFFLLLINRKMYDHAMKKEAEKQKALVHKNDEELLGKRMSIKRRGKAPVSVNFYQTSFDDNQAAVFVCHGGTFLDGDADQLDTWCMHMCDEWHKTIISINYTTIDQEKLPYPQEEIRDTVLYFAENADIFHLDPSQFVFLGFSAGAYLAVSAASLLKERKFNMKGAILVQPFIDGSLIRMADMRLHISPVSILFAGKPTNDHLETYSEHLESGKVDYVVKMYEDAVPGFIEYNNPEFEKNPLYKNSGAYTDEQRDMAHAAEMWIGNQMDGYLFE